MTRRAVIAALALLATPALAQSTVVLPQPGANGLQMPGGGWADRPAGGSGS
jgi:hypothetical protein